jgi:hypothetical protein
MPTAGGVFDGFHSVPLTNWDIEASRKNGRLWLRRTTSMPTVVAMETNAQIIVVALTAFSQPDREKKPLELD